MAGEKHPPNVEAEAPAYAAAWLSYIGSDEHAAGEKRLIDAVAATALGRVRSLAHPPVIADLGCGDGALIRALAAEERAGARFIGADANPALLARAEGAAPAERLRLIVHDFEAEPSVDCLGEDAGKVDLVLCVRLLNYLSDDAVRGLLASCWDLCPHGDLMIVLPVEDPAMLSGDANDATRVLDVDFEGVRVRHYVRSVRWYFKQIAAARYGDGYDVGHANRPDTDELTHVFLLSHTC